MAPKKQPAVSRDTTFEEISALLEVEKPELPCGIPKSSLKPDMVSTDE